MDFLDPAINATAEAVNQGGQRLAYFFGDSMMSLNSNSAPNHTDAPSAIVGMISYTPDPFSFDFVKEWWGISLIIFVVIALAYIMAGGGFALLSQAYPSMARRLAWLESGTYQNNFRLKPWLHSIVLALLFPIVTYFGLSMILQLSYVLTALVTSATLQAIPPTVDNIVVYIFMAVIYLLLSIIIGIRDIIIILFCAGGLILAALYLIPSLQRLVKSIFVYFLGLVFMQPIMVFVAAVGIMFIKEIPAVLLPLTASLYSALMLILLLTGLFFVFGLGWISKLVTTAEVL